MYYNKQLTKLPELPESLFRLCCSENQLTHLPKLPESLTELFCISNRLIQLPKLPKNIIYVNVEFKLGNIHRLQNREQYIKTYNLYKNTILILSNKFKLPYDLKRMLIGFINT